MHFLAKIPGHDLSLSLQYQNVFALRAHGVERRQEETQLLLFEVGLSAHIMWLGRRGALNASPEGSIDSAPGFK